MYTPLPGSIDVLGEAHRIEAKVCAECSFSDRGRFERLLAQNVVEFPPIARGTIVRLVRIYAGRTVQG